MSLCRSATDKLFRCVWFINSDLSKGDRKVQTRLKYSAASLWLIREAQLWIYWWHLTVGHKGGGGKKNHIISCFYIFHFWLLFSSKCTGVCRRQLQKCWQKQNKKKPSTSWWLLLKTVYKKTPKLYIHQHNYTYIWYILHYWVYSRE